MYDLKNDPHELKDLAGNPEHHDTLERLKKTLHEYLNTHEDSNPIETEKAIGTGKGSAGKRKKGETKPKKRKGQ